MLLLSGAPRLGVGHDAIGFDRVTFLKGKILARRSRVAMRDERLTTASGDS